MHISHMRNGSKEDLQRKKQKAAEAAESCRAVSRKKEKESGTGQSETAAQSPLQHADLGEGLAEACGTDTIGTGGQNEADPYRGNPIKGPTDPYQELAIAVIRQAAEDYRYLAGISVETGSALEQQRTRKQMASISCFFLGDWYYMLSGLDNGSTILKMLDTEVFGNDEST